MSDEKFSGVAYVLGPPVFIGSLNKWCSECHLLLGEFNTPECTRCGSTKFLNKDEVGTMYAKPGQSTDEWWKENDEYHEKIQKLDERERQRFKEWEEEKKNGLDQSFKQWRRNKGMSYWN